MPRATRACGALIALILAAGAARADQFYVVVFGAEAKPPRPKLSHSFATFVRIPGCDPCGSPGADAGPVEWFTISWMPCKIDLTPNVPFSEPGHNFTLEESFDIARDHCEYVTGFGPYQIKGELYRLAQKHWRKLERGEVRYKTIDTTYNPNRVSNCIHALTIFNTVNRRPRIGRTNFGDTASYYVTDSYEPWIICPKQVHCWVADLLGLGRYAVIWRTLEQGPPPLLR